MQRSTCSATLPSKDSGQSNTTGTINSVYFQSLSDLYKTSTILNIKYLLGKKKGKNLSLLPLSYNITSQINIIPFINHGHSEIKTLPLITDNSGLFLSFNQNMQLWGGSIKTRKVGSILTGGGIHCY